MDQKKISLLSAKPGKLDALIDAVPALFGKVKDLKEQFTSDDSSEKSDKSDNKSDDRSDQPGW